MQTTYLWLVITSLQDRRRPYGCNVVTDGSTYAVVSPRLLHDARDASVQGRIAGKTSVKRVDWLREVLKFEPRKEGFGRSHPGTAGLPEKEALRHRI
jgi:hypothetical protein